MKIKLVRENDINVLIIMDEISLHEAKVIKAGVVKIAKEGKDKIIIQLADHQELSDEVVKEFSDVHALSKPHGAIVVLAGTLPEVRDKFRHIPVKDHLHCYDSLEYAIKFFSEHLVDKIEIPEVIKINDISGMDEAELESKHNELLEQNRVFQELLRERNIDELIKLRNTLASVTLELKTLENLESYMKKHAKPRVDAEVYYEKFQEAEHLLTEFMKAAKVFVY